MMHYTHLTKIKAHHIHPQSYMQTLNLRGKKRKKKKDDQEENKGKYFMKIPHTHRERERERERGYMRLDFRFLFPEGSTFLLTKSFSTK